MKPRQGKIHTLETLLPILADHKRRGDVVVFTNGCFDILHKGHIRYLTEARKQGDLLVIAVNTDATVREAKGPERPINPAAERIELLAAFSFCDYVFEFFEPTPHEIIAQIVPDVLVKGGDWAADQIVGRDIVEAAGGKVVRINQVPGASTTNIVGKIRKN